MLGVARGDMQLSSPSRLQVRRAIPVVVMVVGAAILFYVGTQYWTMYSEQRRLAQEWEQQQQPLSTDGGTTTATAADGLTRITIPKINLNAVIVEGTSHRALLRGPGHLTDTPAPGENGNSVL